MAKLRKYDAGAYCLTYFNQFFQKLKKKSKVYPSYGKAKLAGDKWLLKNPGCSYSFHQTVYNSATSSKWDYTS